MDGTEEQRFGGTMEQYSNSSGFVDESILSERVCDFQPTSLTTSSLKELEQRLKQIHSP